MSDHKCVLRIRVTKDGNEEKVNVTVPLGLAKLAKFGPLAKQLEKQDIDIDDILEDIEDMDDGKIVDVTDEKSRDHVEIFVEKRGAKTPEATTAG